MPLWEQSRTSRTIGNLAFTVSSERFSRDSTICLLKTLHTLTVCRQGYVISTFIWGLYVEELLEQLRKLGVGCHIGGVFMGATIFADDVLLLVPNRTAQGDVQFCIPS